MNDASTLRMAAVFSFLSPLSIVLVIPLAGAVAAVGGGPGPIDFGDGATLERLAALGAAPARVDLLALLGPALALPVGFGWYLLLRRTSRLATLGILLWYLGMIFIVTQDALQLAFVTRLPAAYAAADVVARPAIVAVGASLAAAIEVLASVGRLGDFGFLLVALAILRCASTPKWIGAVGVLSSGLSLGAGILSLALPQVTWLGLGVPIGIVLLLVCIAALGVVMLREANKEVTP